MISIKKNIWWAIRTIAIAIITITLFFGCSSDDVFVKDNSVGSNENGQSGSTACFTTVGNYLYTVDYNSLKTFKIDNNNQLTLQNTVNIYTYVETIFASGNKLFLGTRSGVYIYSINNPDNPVYISFFSHFYSCDPVIVYNNYAYATLSSSGPCSRGTNQLIVANVTDPYNPVTVKTINLESPKGLGANNNILFVCDNGIKIYDITQPSNPVYKKTIDINANDIIVLDDILLITADDGMHQYSYNSSFNVTYLSTLYSTK